MDLKQVLDPGEISDVTWPKDRLKKRYYSY